MKKLLIILAILTTTFVCISCGRKTSTVQSSTGTNSVQEAGEETVIINQSENLESVELIVFAAASMTETMNEIKKLYESKNSNIHITYNFDSSGTLVKQIIAGADCDIFISAAQKQMNQIDITKDEEVNKDRNDFVLEGTRVNLLENKVALAVPSGNPKNINSFKDLTSEKLSLLAIGNSDVPVGAYTLEILEYLKKPVSEFEKEKKVTYGSNVKEVTTQVKEGTVDAGIIYATDAASANLTVVDLATKDMCKQVIYPAAVLKETRNEKAAREFLKFLQSKEAMDVFQSVGFAKAS
jgi:molybdate transport system substrate-binding protein